ncbi:phage holin, lambda family [Serratia marcescens]|nr:phage holin, lambda family [Serratia marcescens]MBH2866118.1 phage holin, lambda family [Serratia marcescens]MBW4238488.1 phage holin, lambda family [Enterobacter roggenkampii]
MKMQNNIHTWADAWELLRMWWNGDVLLSIIMAALRIAYTGGGWRHVALESPLCGAMTLTVASGLDYFGLPPTLSVAIGGPTGFIGADQIRAAGIRILRSRTGGDTKD